MSTHSGDRKRNGRPVSGRKTAKPEAQAAEQSPLITLTTDFGYLDPFVGIMKGVILGIHQGARIVDLSHGIEPRDIVQASESLRQSYSFFPVGSIHVCVVDPGVGSSRRPILGRVNGHYFIGPDNGVFSGMLEEATGSAKGWILTESRYFLPLVSSTFHGRDIFAPVAAWLSKGVRPAAFGPQLDRFTIIASEAPVSRDGHIRGRVTGFDGFGNASTNIQMADIHSAFSCETMADLAVSVKTTRRTCRMPMFSCYVDAGAGDEGGLINSAGRLEIFVSMGNAREKLRLMQGDRVSISRRRRRKDGRSSAF